MSQQKERWVEPDRGQKAPEYTFEAVDAVRSAIWLRFGLCGAGGSGKSYSALAIATSLADLLGLGPVYVIDSENKSALRYAKSPKNGNGFGFKHVEMKGDYSPAAYCAAMDFAVGCGAKVILIDSISHEWDGANGCLEQVDRIAAERENRGKSADSFSGWRIVTPLHRKFIERILGLPAHVIFTVRAKTSYEMREDPKRPGKQTFAEVGLGPVQRDGIKYEPDIFAWMSDSRLTIDKTRCDRLPPGATFDRPGADVARLLADWIEDTEGVDARAGAAERLEQWKAQLRAARTVESLDVTLMLLRRAESHAPRLVDAAVVTAEIRRGELAGTGEST